MNALEIPSCNGGWLRKLPMRLAVAVFISLPFCGCRPAAPPATSVESATRLLQSTLEAWITGATVAQMRDQQPPVYVADELWLQGMRLKHFNIDGAGQPFGTNVRFHVTLEGSDAQGRKVERRVKYLVATTPAQSIAREDR